jgi:hypothetical protein
MICVPLHFSDFDFRHTFARRRNAPVGASGLKWTPYGMPRFHPQLATTVFYLYGRDRKGDLAGPSGTGVFVVKRADIPGHHNHVYAITAYHVAISGGSSSIRINFLEDGATTLRSKYIEKDPSEWSFISGEDDIAAIDVTDDVGTGSDVFIRGVPDTDFVTTKFINDGGLSLGEDGFMLGLFTGNPGQAFNLPSARFGNLSQLANFVHPVEQGHGIVRPSHVFDMHSRPGFSGSPVFIFRTPFGDLTNVTQDGTFQLDILTIGEKYDAFVKLLGIHSGQFVETLKARKENSAPIHDGDKLKIQSSMTIVVPAWAIEKLLNEPAFVEQRAMREKRFDPKIMPETADAKPLDDEENPRHLEDFKRLVDVAARKRPQDDQT